MNVLRTQLTLGFSVVVLLGVGTTGALLIRTSYGYALQRLRSQQTLLAENRAASLAFEVAAEEVRLGWLGQLEDMDPSDGDDEPERAVFAHAKNNRRFFGTRTELFDPEGQQLGMDGGATHAGEWLTEAQRRETPFVIDETTDGGSISARLVVPLRQAGRFLGVLSSTFLPDEGGEWSKKLRVEAQPSGSAALVSRDGRVVAAMGVAFHADLPPERLAMGEAHEGRPWSEWETDDHGRMWLFTAAPIPQLGWVFAMRQARDELDDELAQEIRSFVWLLVGGLAAALGLGFLSSRSLARPIVELARIARDVEQGRLESIPQPTRTGELGALERAFFSMTATLDARVKERTQALEAAQQELVEQGRFAAMGKTAAAIAHELKNALNGLGVAVDVLAQGKLPPAAQEPIREQVRLEVARLRDITDNLHIFSGTPKLHLSPTALPELVHRAVAAVSDRVEASRIDLRLELPERLQPLDCDGQKLQGVLINLVKNAVEAVEPAIDADAAEPPGQVVVTIRDAPDHVEIEVADNGTGIAEEVEQHLWEPFFTTKRTGTGLGLPIGKKVVEAHGGTLSWSRASPRGTRMVVRLPRVGSASQGENR